VDIFDDVLGLLKNDLLSIAGLVGILACLLWMQWFRYNKRIFLPDGNNPSAKAEQHRVNDLAARRRWIEERHFETVYLDLLGRMLDWVAMRFTHDQERLAQKHLKKGWAETLFGVQPFTENSYLLCLRLAVVYPWLAFFLVWLVGGPGEFSGLSLFPAETPPVGRMIAGFPVMAMVWLSWKTSSLANLDKSISWWHVILGFFALAILFILGFGLIAILVVAMASFFVVNPALGIVTLSFVFFISGLVDFFDSIVIVFVIIFIFITFFVCFIIRVFLATPCSVCGYWIVFNVFCLLLSVIGLVWPTYIPTSEDKVLFIFLIILPLINTFMDWVSLGVTRGFLYALHQRMHHGLMALALVVFDVVLALVFLLSMVSITVLVLAGANATALHWNGRMLIDLHVLLDGLAADPLALEYGWIHFMMLTTLIPTLIHFTIAGASAVMVFPNRWRESILRHWDERGDAQTAALWYVTLVPALGLIAPLLAMYGLYALLSAHGGAVGILLLDWARALSVVFD